MAEDIERAIFYASHTSTGVGVSPQLEKDQKEKEYQSLVSRLENFDKVMSLQERLEQDLPYFELASDENIRSYFSRWGVSIDSKEDLKLFSYVLGERLGELAKSSDSAQKAIQEKEYRLQLRGLPAAISRMNDSLVQLDQFKAPFEAVIRYVNKLICSGFSMNEDGSSALEKYDGHLVISHFSDDNSSPLPTINYCNCSIRICTIQRLEKECKIYNLEKKHWWRKAKKVERLERYFTEDISYALKFGGCYYGNGNSFENLKRFVRDNPSTNLPILRDFLGIMFNLPKYIHNYALRTSQQINSVLGDIATDFPKDLITNAPHD